MKIEFYDSDNKAVLKASSVFSLQTIPRTGEHVFLPPDLDGERGGTYEVTNTRYLYWGDPRNSEGNDVQLTGIVVYVKRITGGLAEPIPVN
jgi:hypothetical protein